LFSFCISWKGEKSTEFGNSTNSSCSVLLSLLRNDGIAAAALQRL